MQYRSLGQQGCEVSSIGLGCMGMSEGYDKPDSASASKTLLHAFDQGINFFDTAPYYGRGENEKLLAKTFKQKKDEIIIATKVGLERDARFDEIYHTNHSREHLRDSIECSLKRLKRDVIDIVYLQGRDPHFSIEETVETLSGLVLEGKVRYLGLTELEPEDIAKANDIHHITAYQGEFSLWDNGKMQQSVLKRCRELGIGFVATAPLGRGFLTGKITSPKELPVGDSHRQLPQFQESAFASNQKLLEGIRSIANHTGCSLAQCVLAWVLAQGVDIVPIPGSKQTTFLNENLETVDVVSLSDKDTKKLNQLSKEYMKALPKVVTEE